MDNLIYTSFLPESSLIHEVEYSYLPKGDVHMVEALLIKFVDGRKHQYLANPIDIIPAFQDREFSMAAMYQDLLECESVGKYFLKNINYKLQFNKVL